MNEASLIFLYKAIEILFRSIKYGVVELLVASSTINLRKEVQYFSQ